MGNYHKVTPEEHQQIIASRHSVCPVPYNTISEKMGIPERTVRRYANKLPIKNIVIRHRSSMFDPHKDEIEALLNKDMGKQSHNIKTAMLTFRDMHPELKFEKTAFYDFVHAKCDLTREPKLARLPLEHDYGEAQIDFCDIVYYRNRRRVNGHQFTLTLTKSGISFIQIFPAENQQCLFEAMTNIFTFIGFVPKSILFDNASTAVLSTRRKGKEAVPTNEYANFARWYGFEYKFCNPASGWEKGAVEHANATKRKAYFTPPPQIIDEREYNEILLRRCMDDASTEKHYQQGVPKIELFEQEKTAGIPLPKDVFPCSRTEIHKTDKCAIIRVKGCRYSVSDKHPRKNVLVTYDAFNVEICEMTGETICRHRRSYKLGSTTIDPTMYADALAARPRARIKQSDNEYTEEHTAEILTEIKNAVTSARPAARDDVLTDFCDRHGIECFNIPTKQTALLYHLASYSTDKDYDTAIQSNSRMVQTAKTGRPVCRGGTGQKMQGTGLSDRTVGGGNRPT